MRERTIETSLPNLGHGDSLAQRSSGVLHSQSRLRSGRIRRARCFHPEHVDSRSATTHRRYAYGVSSQQSIETRFLESLGAWQSTVEQLPSTRRFSHQPLVTSRSTTDLSASPPLRLKARSLGKEKRNETKVDDIFSSLKIIFIKQTR